MHMFEIQCFFVLVILCIFDQAAALVILPKVEENDIVKAEAVIRNTTNGLFSSLRLTNFRNKTWAKENSLIHNYFVSLTLQDYNSLKEISKLTRVDKSDIENVTTDFIALLNEILDEENIIKLQNILMNEDSGKGFNIEDEVQNLKYLQTMQVKENFKPNEINKKVLEILQKEDDLDLDMKSTNSNGVKHSNENILDDIPFWPETDKLLGGRRIFDGKRTKIKHFPFMASIQIFNKFQCAGCIIKSDLVITAASCLQLAWNNRFFRENPPFLSVRVGSSFYEIGGELIGVQEVYFNPDYNPKNLENNLALIRLERKIRLKKKKVKKIRIDKEDHKLPKNAGKIEMLGWGATTRSNKLHGPWEDKLKQAVLHIYPYEECRDLYSKEYVTKTNFCAGFISKGTGACNRDIGGPGIISGILVGIISFGSPSCGTPDAPTVFTKLGFYNKWIEDIMDQDVPFYKKRTTLKRDTWSYPENSWLASSDSKINTIKYPKPTVVNQTSLGTNVHKTTLTSEPNKYDLKFTNIDKDLFKNYLKTMFESEEEENFLSIEIPKERYEITTANIKLSAGNVKPIQPVFFQKITYEPKLKRPRKPKQYALRSPLSDIQRPPSLPPNYIKGNSKTTEIIRTTYPQIVIDSPLLIDDTPTRLNIELTNGNKSYTLVKNDYQQKVLLPDEISNIEIELVANGKQKDNAMKPSIQGEMQFESLRNQLHQFVNKAGQEQMEREIQLKGQLSEIIENSQVQENIISQVKDQNDELTNSISHVLTDTKLSETEKHDLILQLISKKESQNDELNNRISNVLIDTKLSDTEKHDLILQLVSDKKSQNIKENAVDSVFKLAQALEELGPTKLQIENNAKPKEKENLHPKYRESYIKNVVTDSTLQEEDKYALILQTKQVNQSLYNMNSKPDKGSEHFEENIQIGEPEKYIMNVLTDPTLQEKEKYDLISQAINGNHELYNIPSTPKNKRENDDERWRKELNHNILREINSSIKLERENKELMNNKEKVVVVTNSKQRESDTYDFLTKIMYENAPQIVENQSQIFESNNEIIPEEKDENKESDQSILELIDQNQTKENEKLLTDQEISMKQVITDSNLQDEDKENLIKQLLSKKSTNNLKESIVDKNRNLELEEGFNGKNRNIVGAVTKTEGGIKTTTANALIIDFITDNAQHKIDARPNVQDAKLHNKIEWFSDADEKYFFESPTQKNFQFEEINTEAHENLSMREINNLEVLDNEQNLSGYVVSQYPYNYETYKQKTDNKDDQKTYNIPLFYPLELENAANKLKKIPVTDDNDKVRNNLEMETKQKEALIASMDKQSLKATMKEMNDLNDIIERVLYDPELEDKQKENMILQVLSAPEINNITNKNTGNQDMPIEKLQNDIEKLFKAATQENESRKQVINNTITEIFGNIGTLQSENTQFDPQNNNLKNNIQNVLTDVKIDNRSKFETILQSDGDILGNISVVQSENLQSYDQHINLEKNIQKALSDTKMYDESKHDTVNNLRLGPNIPSQTLFNTQFTSNVDRVRQNELNGEENLETTILQQMGKPIIEEREKPDNFSQLVVTGVIAPETQERSSLNKKIYSPINSNLDNMLNFIKSFKPKMNITTTQYVQPLPETAQKQQNYATSSKEETAYFDKILQSLSELEKYAGGGHGMKLMNTMENNGRVKNDINLPSFALPVLEKESVKSQKLETDELIKLLSKVLTPQEAKDMPVQVNKKTIADREPSFSSEILSIGSNFENMKNNLQNIFSLLPQYEITAKDYTKNNTQQTSRQNEYQSQQIQNQDMPIVYQRSRVSKQDEFDNVMTSYINLLKNENVAKNKVAEVLATLLKERNSKDKQDNLMESYYKLLTNENVSKNKVAEILEILLTEQNTDNNKNTLMESYIQLLKNKNVAKNKVADILITLLKDRNGNNIQNLLIASAGNKKEVELKTSSIDGFENLNNTKNSEEERDWNKNNGQKYTNTPTRIQNSFYFSTLPPSLLVKQDSTLKDLDYRIMEALSDSELQERSNQTNQAAITQIENAKGTHNNGNFKEGIDNTDTKFGRDYILDSLGEASMIGKEDSNALLQLDTVYSQEENNVQQLDSKYEQEEYNISKTETTKQDKKISSTSSLVLKEKRDGIFKHLSDSLFSVVGSAAKQIGSVLKPHNTKSYKLESGNKHQAHRISQLDSNLEEQHKGLNLENSNNILRNELLYVSSTPSHIVNKGGIFKNIKDSFFGLLGAAEKVKSKALQHLGSAVGSTKAGAGELNKNKKELRVLQLDDLITESQITTVNQLSNKNSEELDTFSHNMGVLGIEEKQMDNINIGNNPNNEFIASIVTPLSSVKRGDFVKNIKDGLFGLLETVEQVKDNALQQFGTGIKSQKTESSYKKKEYTILQTTGNTKATKIESASNGDLKNSFLYITSPTLFHKQKEGTLKNLAKDFLMVLGNPDAIEEEKRKSILQFASAVETQGNYNETNLVSKSGTGIELQKADNLLKIEDNTILEIDHDTKITKKESDEYNKNSFLSTTSSTSLRMHQQGDLKNLANDFLMVIGNPDAIKEEKREAILQFASAVDLQGKYKEMELTSDDNNILLNTKAPQKGDNDLNFRDISLNNLVSPVLSPPLLIQSEGLSKQSTDTFLQLSDYPKAVQNKNVNDMLQFANTVDAETTNRNKYIEVDGKEEENRVLLTSRNTEIESKDTKFAFLRQPNIAKSNAYSNDLKEVTTMLYLRDKEYDSVNTMGKMGNLKFQNVLDTVISNKEGEKVYQFPYKTPPKTVAEIPVKELQNLRDETEVNISGNGVKFNFTKNTVLNNLVKDIDLKIHRMHKV